MRNSRRARTVLTLLLLAAFTLITLDYRSNSLSGVRNGMSTVFGPIEDGVSGVTHPIGRWFTSVFHAGGYRNRNDALQRRVDQLEGQLHLTQLERNELTQDQQLLHIAAVGQYTIVGARVVAVGGGLAGDEETVTINKGLDNGILPDETVISGAGLVGRTLTVGHTTATVLLAIDPTFAAGARTESQKVQLGSLTGQGAGQPFRFEIAEQPGPQEVVLTKGEALVTFRTDAASRPFVPEVPIGTITSTHTGPAGTTLIASVQPYVDFTSLGIVGVVVRAPKSIKHDSVLPTPAPTVTVTVTASPGSTSSSTASPGATTSSTP